MLHKLQGQSYSAEENGQIKSYSHGMAADLVIRIQSVEF